MTTASLIARRNSWQARRTIRVRLLKSARRRLTRARRKDTHPRGHLVELVAKRERQVAYANKIIAWRTKQIRLRGYLLPKPWYRGKSSNVSRATKRCIARAVYAGLYVTSTTGGQHASGSWHYARKAVDVAGTWDRMVEFQRAELRRGAGKYNELFGPDNAACVKNGSRVTLGEGTGLEDQHDTHVHAAPRS